MAFEKKHSVWRPGTEWMWGVKAEVIPVIVEGLRGVTKNLENNLAKIPAFPDSCICQYSGIQKDTQWRFQTILR